MFDDANISDGDSGHHSQQTIAVQTSMTQKGRCYMSSTAPRFEPYGPRSSSNSLYALDTSSKNASFLKRPFAVVFYLDQIWFFDVSHCLDFVYLRGVGEDVGELSVNCGWGFSAVGFQPRQWNMLVGQPQHEVRRFGHVSNLCKVQIALLPNVFARNAWSCAIRPGRGFPRCHTAKCPRRRRCRRRFHRWLVSSRTGTFSFLPST